MSNPTAGGVPIPPGLTRCPVCGEYRGPILAAYLDWDDETPDASEPDEEIEVTCLCEGIPCRRCGKNRIHRPISNSYDPETNTVRHHSWFSYIKPCNECRASEKGHGSRS